MPGFQSTRPSRASTISYPKYHKVFSFQSTRPSRASTCAVGHTILYPVAFQSTRPSRASTSASLRPADTCPYFNPQGPRGPRPSLCCFIFSLFQISIHKALAGLDVSPHPPPPTWSRFQSTRPSRASTRAYQSVLNWAAKFQSTRPSRASTKSSRMRRSAAKIFQSTRPSRASTPVSQPKVETVEISIHKALAGLDVFYFLSFDSDSHFNPQGPRGPRQQNYPTIPPHPPNFLCIMSSPPYFNLLHPFTQPIFTAFPLFFRCESPRHFMLAWHSHLV